MEVEGLGAQSCPRARGPLQDVVIHLLMQASLPVLGAHLLGRLCQQFGGVAMGEVWLGRQPEVTPSKDLKKLRDQGGLAARK